MNTPAQLNEVPVMPEIKAKSEEISWAKGWMPEFGHSESIACIRKLDFSEEPTSLGMNLKISIPTKTKFQDALEQIDILNKSVERLNNYCYDVNSENIKLSKANDKLREINQSYEQQIDHKNHVIENLREKIGDTELSNIELRLQLAKLIKQNNDLKK
jgi:hypothetical protein